MAKKPNQNKTILNQDSDKGTVIVASQRLVNQCQSISVSIHLNSILPFDQVCIKVPCTKACIQHATLYFSVVSDCSKGIGALSAPC